LLLVLESLNLGASWHSYNRTDEQPAVQSPQCEVKIIRRTGMTQKVIDVVGTSKESFAKAAANAVAEAAKTVRGMKWARVAELEMELDGNKIVRYRATTKIYFDIKK
jgi:flavin-binding protein dodecin